MSHDIISPIDEALFAALLGDVAITRVELRTSLEVPQVVLRVQYAVRPHQPADLLEAFVQADGSVHLHQGLQLVDTEELSELFEAALSTYGTLSRTQRETLVFKVVALINQGADVIKREIGRTDFSDLSALLRYSALVQSKEREIISAANA